jgi:dihydroorotase-like cyclic amidohydrolase
MREALGPIDYVLLEFPDQEPSGEAAAALADLVDAGIINLYDILAVRKAADGSISGFELTDLGDGVAGFTVFAGARSGLLGDEDVAEAGAVMAPGTIAVLLVYENAWAAPFVAAARKAGGQMVATARVPAQDIIEALDALEASI